MTEGNLAFWMAFQSRRLVTVTPDIVPVLRPLVARTGMPLSEYSVANLVLFCATHRYVLAKEPAPHILGVTYDGKRHAMPLGSIGSELAERLLDGVDHLGPFADDGPAMARSWRLACDWLDADSDYIFEATRLAGLVGAKAKRSQARAFERDYSPQAVELQGNLVEAAAEVLEGWLADVGREPDATDYEPCREALRLMEVLQLEGVVVFAEGRPVAFLISGPAADGSRIVHFAKGRREFAGAYPWMFSHYAAHLGSGRLNFEQDLGNGRFARAKQALAPITRLRKWRLFRSG